MKFYDAFISYGRADSKAFATKIYQELTSAGLTIWFDQNDIPLAVDFQEQINDGIEKSHNFLFIIAPHSVNSPYCLKEIELALKLNKRIIPLLHVEQINQETWQQRNPHKSADDWQEYQQKGLHSSYPNMHPEISKINWVYFRENLDDFSTSFTGLLNAINKHQNYVEQHTNFLIQALEWSRNQQQTNYLLVSKERQKAEDWLKQRFTQEQPPCLPTDLHCEFICESTKNSQNLLTQVFISSSEKNNILKNKIRTTLMRESFTVWTNQVDIKSGVVFQEAINNGIEGADNFVYLISLDSLKSEYCQQELNLALATNKRIIPILIENDLDVIPPSLRKIQFLDFTESEDEEKYRISADKLLQQLKEDTSYHEKHKILLVKARKWQKQNQNPSLLLQGYNLQNFETWLKLAKQREDYPPLPLQEEFITASINKPEESSLEVFISYSRADSDLARKLNDALQELGKTTWFDQESIATGTDFQQEIYRGIASSDNFVFIISPNSVNSPYCADEVEYAEKLGKRFVTILHRPLTAEELKKLPPALASVQWLDFNQHDGEFYANFNELVRTLNTDRDHVRNHTKWSQQALEWEEKNNSGDLLLRGSEFAIAKEWLKIAEVEKKNPPATDLHKKFLGASQSAQQRFKIIIGGTIGVIIILLTTLFIQDKNSRILLETIFLNLDTPTTVTTLPKLEKLADDWKEKVDKLKSSENPTDYYNQHRLEINKSLAYYRQILLTTNRLSLAYPDQKTQLQPIAQRAEKSLTALLLKYRLPQLESELKQKNFGKINNPDRILFENQYSQGALRTTYEILFINSGIGADLNKDGFIADQQEVSLMPCEILQKIEELWRNATDKKCGWSSKEGFYEDKDCTSLPQDATTLYVAIFGYKSEDPIDKIKSCKINPES